MSNPLYCTCQLPNVDQLFQAPQTTNSYLFLQLWAQQVRSEMVLQPSSEYLGLPCSAHGLYLAVLCTACSWKLSVLFASAFMQAANVFLMQALNAFNAFMQAFNAGCQLRCIVTALTHELGRSRSPKMLCILLVRTLPLVLSFEQDAPDLTCRAIWLGYILFLCVCWTSNTTCIVFYTPFHLGIIFCRDALMPYFSEVYLIPDHPSLSNVNGTLRASNVMDKR